MFYKQPQKFVPSGSPVLYLKIYQELIIRTFSDTHQDYFKNLMTRKDFEHRMLILKTVSALTSNQYNLHKLSPNV